MSCGIEEPNPILGSSFDAESSLFLFHITVIAMFSLPVSVIEHILFISYLEPDEQLWNRHSHRIRRHWFASLLRINKSWYTAGQPMLYRRIEADLDTPHLAKILLRTLKRKPDIVQMVKVVRVGDHDWTFRDEVADLIMCTLAVPKIPLVTERGTKSWLRARAFRRLNRIITICVAAVEARVGAEELGRLVHGLQAAAPRLTRLEIELSNRLDADLWRKIFHPATWAHLRALRLDASSTHWELFWDNEIPYLTSGFARQFQQLETLEVFGRIKQTVMREVLQVLQPTLQRLTCPQPYHEKPVPWRRPLPKDFFFLAPVQETLVALTLKVGCETLINLSKMNALQTLTVILTHEGSREHGQFDAANVFPPQLRSIEYHTGPRVRPWDAAERVRNVLCAYDIGVLPNLHSMRIIVTIDRIRDVAPWLPVFLFVHIAVQKRSLNIRTDLRLNFSFMEEAEHARVNRFAKAAYLSDQQHHKEYSEGLSRGQNPVISVVAWIGCAVCSVAYFGCCCCWTARLLNRLVCM